MAHGAGVKYVELCSHTHTCVLPGGGKGKNARALFLLFLDAVSVVASRRPAKQAEASSGVDDLCAHTIAALTACMQQQSRLTACSWSAHQSMALQLKQPALPHGTAVRSCDVLPLVEQRLMQRSPQPVHQPGTTAARFCLCAQGGAGRRPRAWAGLRAADAAGPAVRRQVQRGLRARPAALPGALAVPRHLRPRARQGAPRTRHRTRLKFLRHWRSKRSLRFLCICQKSIVPPTQSVTLKTTSRSLRSGRSGTGKHMA